MLHNRCRLRLHPQSWNDLGVGEHTDPAAPAPRVFLSHATEDKERFVLPFATALRAAGVDAWVDQWEMQAGDSLVQRIFDHGIAGAEAFVVVLSHVSVTKPWVREELDAGVVQRINSGGSLRLIPIVLDEDVTVPMAIRHLLWRSVPALGFGGVVDDVVRAIHGGSVRPALGSPPPYLRRELDWLDDPADDLVLGLLVEEWRKYDLNTVLYSDEVQAAAEAAGVSAEAFEEAMHSLLNQRLIDARPMAGGGRWWLQPFPDQVWLRLETQAGVDIDALRQRVLSMIVNDGRDRLESEDFGVHDFTLRAVLNQLQGDGLLRAHQLANGGFAVGGVSPLARRALRD